MTTSQAGDGGAGVVDDGPETAQATVLRNDHSDYGRALRPADAAIVDATAADAAERYLTLRRDHAPTSLHPLPGLARALGIDALHVKDESTRLGLGSFKALGGSYAVVRLTVEEAERRLGREVDISEALSSEVRTIAAELTFACATDGNHGRAVAAGAQMVGARAVVFVHEGVSTERVAAIERFGAEVLRVPGTYDDSVATAARRSVEEGWTLLSDTTQPADSADTAEASTPPESPAPSDPSTAGQDRVPGLVMQGYTVLVREALEVLDSPPTHVFVQAGVGGIAGSVAGHLAEVLGERRPHLIVVEPSRAACVFECARAGHPVQIPPGEPTVMAMLECYQASQLAWRILSRTADAFMTVDDEAAIEAIRRLARPIDADPAIVAGESGGAGLAGLMRAVRDEATRAELELDHDARVLVINTEGATDPERYQELVGVHPSDV